MGTEDTDIDGEGEGGGEGDRGIGSFQSINDIDSKASSPDMKITRKKRKKRSTGAAYSAYISKWRGYGGFRAKAVFVARYFSSVYLSSIMPFFFKEGKKKVHICHNILILLLTIT